MDRNKLEGIENVGMTARKSGLWSRCYHITTEIISPLLQPAISLCRLHLKVDAFKTGEGCTT